VGLDGNGGIDKVKQAYRLIQESLKELEEVEYALQLLEKELEEYKSLVDKESYILKSKFIKQKLARLIERTKFSGDFLACSRIEVSVVGNVPESEKEMIINYVANFIDGHIRPGDIIFKTNDSVIGIIFPIKDKEDFKAIEERLKSVLLNLKAKAYSSQNVLINFNVDTFLIDKNSSPEEVFKKLEG